MSFDPRDPPDPYDDRRRDPREGARDPYDYRDPLEAGGGAGEGAKSSARGKLIGPAILLMLTGVLNLVFGAIGCIAALGISSMPPAEFEKMMQQQNPGQWKTLQQQGWTPDGMKSMIVTIYLVTGISGLVCGVINLAGATCMLIVKGRILAIFSSILAILSPSCCCLLGLGTGIWALIVLMNPEVREGFR
jgi:hypothetical protein